MDRGRESASISRLLVDQVTALFGIWYRARDGTLFREQFQISVIRGRIDAIHVTEGAFCLVNSAYAYMCSDHLNREKFVAPAQMLHFFRELTLYL